MMCLVDDLCVNFIHFLLGNMNSIIYLYIYMEKCNLNTKWIRFEKSKSQNYIQCCKKDDFFYLDDPRGCGGSGYMTQYTLLIQYNTISVS